MVVWPARSVIFCMVAMAGALARGIAAAEPAPSESTEGAVASLLEQGEHVSPKALAEARAQYVRLHRMPGFDDRARMAFAVVLINQHRLDEAAGVLGEVIEHQPKSQPAWRLKIWALAAGGKLEGVPADIRSLAAVLRQPKQTRRAAAADASEIDQTAKFLGRLFGYLEGPRANTLPEEELRRAKQYALSRLGDGRSAFEEAEQDVNEKFVELNEQLAQSREDSSKALVARKADLDEKKRELGKKESNLDQAAEVSKSETKDKLETLQSSAAGLQRALAQAQSRLAMIDAIIAARDYWMTPVSLTKTVRTGPYTNQALNELAQLMNQRQAALCQIANLNQQLAGTAFEASTVAGSEERTTLERKQKTAQLKRNERRLNDAENMAARHAHLDGASSRKLLQQQRALSTYDRFDFDNEKQRVLASYQSAGHSAPKH